MKFGLVIPFWLMAFSLFSQKCASVDIDPIEYFEVTAQGDRQIQSYLVPCSKSGDLKFKLPSKALVGYVDPESSTPPGILLVVMKRDPGKSVLTIDEFNDAVYRDINGMPLYFSDPSKLIDISTLMNLDNVSGAFFLMPVMVSNINGTDPDTWMEEDCVKLIRHSAIHLVYSPEQHELVHFDEISFTNWPVDTSITDFFDFSFTDQETGEEISFVMTDNRSFRLQFPKSKGVFNFEITWKNYDCSTLEIGKNWAFPAVELIADTVTGYRNSSLCVPVRVRNFESVSGLSAVLSWHTDSLAYSGISHVHPALEPYLEFASVDHGGNMEGVKIRFPSGLDTLTLTDSSVLFEWCGKPLTGEGTTIPLRFRAQDDPASSFYIHGLEADFLLGDGAIEVLKDRELIYDLNQLCNTTDGTHRIKLDVISEPAYPYTYSFHSAEVPDSMVVSTPFVIPDVPPGHYEFTIRDSFGFEITEDFIVLEQVPPNFEVNIDASRVIQPTCLNPMGGQLAVAVAPSNQNYQYELLHGSASFIDDIVSGLEPGKYTIRAKDEEGCVDTVSYTLTNPEEIYVTWDAASMVLCPGDDEVHFEVQDLNDPPDPSLQYQIEGGPVLNVGSVASFTDPGTYQVQLWNEDECTLDTSVTVYAGPEKLTVWDTAAIRINIHDTLNYAVAEPTGLTDISWQYSSVEISDQVDMEYVPQESGELLFSAVVYDRCMYTDTLLVEVFIPDYSKTDYQFPNVFTPNGDGMNDYYSVAPMDNIKQILQLEIFDRYGNAIYKEDYSDASGSLQRGWNGYYGEQEAESGVYVVQVVLELLNGQKKQVGFDVLLLR